MAHFYGGIQGHRGEATRLGTKDSGLHTFANGWNIGATVTLAHNEETGKDEIVVSITTGSNGSNTREIFRSDEDEVKSLFDRYWKIY